MEATTKPPRPSRVRLLLQPTIIRIYKAAGIAALGGILLGLVVFLTVNLFYFFNNSWVRPMILSPSHEKVMMAARAEADAQLQRSQLDNQRLDAVAEVAQLDRAIAAAEKFEADAATLREGPIKDAETALARRELDRADLDRQAAADRRATLQRRMEDLQVRIGEQDELIARLRKSPYLKAAKGRVIVAFVPYDNLEEVRPGAPLYGCEWGLVKCRHVGRVVQLLDGEITDVHPHDNKPMRGVLAEIELTDPEAAQWGALFADHKPFRVF